MPRRGPHTEATSGRLSALLKSLLHFQVCAQLLRPQTPWGGAGKGAGLAAVAAGGWCC
jgi:hypothetical protein